MSLNLKQPREYVITRRVDTFFMGLYSASKFVLRFFKEVLTPPYEGKEIIKQCYEIGYNSLPLISLTGFITGLVFTKQSRPSLADFGATSWLPSLVAIAIIKALVFSAHLQRQAAFHRMVQMLQDQEYAPPSCWQSIRQNKNQPRLF